MGQEGLESGISLELIVAGEEQKAEGGQNALPLYKCFSHESVCHALLLFYFPGWWRGGQDGQQGRAGLSHRLLTLRTLRLFQVDDVVAGKDEKGGQA